MAESDRFQTATSGSGAVLFLQTRHGEAVVVDSLLTVATVHTDGVRILGAFGLGQLLYLCRALVVVGGADFNRLRSVRVHW